MHRPARRAGARPQRGRLFRQPIATLLATLVVLSPLAASAQGGDGPPLHPVQQQPPPGAGPHEITGAELRLFKTDHLGNIAAPSKLHYRFERRGSLQPAIDDDATLAVSVVDGKRQADADFLHGDQRMSLPPIADVDGNPILLHFLERELREMNRLTRGSVSYYRKRIRMALAADPPITDVTVDYQGRKLVAQRIRVDPYLDDPARNRYPAFATRFYTLILSKDIPGEIYQLRAELLEPAKDGAPSSVIQSEVLTFESEE